MTYVGISILGVLAILTVIGLLNGVYAKLRIQPAIAFLIIASMIAGILLPAIRIGTMFSFSIGGFLIPFFISAYLMYQAARRNEFWRCLIGEAVVALTVFFLMYYIPIDTTAMAILSAVAIGLVAAAISYLIGRNGRSAVVSSVMGIYLAQIAVFVVNVIRGIDTPLNLGTGGIFDAIVLSVVAAIVLAEFSEALALGADRANAAAAGQRSRHRAAQSEQAEFYEFKKR